MRIVFVRHGEPDYDLDILTPRGMLQAQAVAKRLERENVAAIYCSPQGRAQQTAAPSAELLKLPVITLDFMHEINSGDANGKKVLLNGSPWLLSEKMLAEENEEITLDGWRKHPYFKNNLASKSYDYVAAGFDRWLETLGYKREGRCYRCLCENDRTVALFSHGGSGACALSRTLNLPFNYMLAAMQYGFTSVTVLRYPGKAGELTYPRLELFNDMAHTIGADRQDPVFGT